MVSAKDLGFRDAKNCSYWIKWRNYYAYFQTELRDWSISNDWILSKKLLDDERSIWCTFILHKVTAVAGGGPEAFE